MSRQKRLERAQLRVLLNVPFFAPGVCRLPVEFTDNEEIKTACTDGKGIIWNTKFFDELPDEVLPTVLCHEACHCLLGHIWRMPCGADHQLWNQACDHAVNLMLKEFGGLQTAKGYADPFPFPAPHDAYCADPAYDGMAEEGIFARLNNQPKQSGKTPGKGNSGANSGPAPGSMPDFGQFKATDGSDGVADRKAKSDWDNTMIQSCAAAKGRGALPGMLEKVLGELVAPVVDWRDVLRSWLREQCADDWDFLTPAMEYSTSEFILPSMKSEKMGPVVFASDWSGSTYGDLVKMFHAEKQSCLDECRPSKLVDFGFDTRVLSQREYVPGDLIDPTIKGGGGTSFADVLEQASSMHPRPKAIVVLTDLDGEFGPDPGVPVIWCVFGGGSTSAPFGEVVKVD